MQPDIHPPSTGHPTSTAEPHPWGQPLPVGHPGHQPPARLAVGVFGRWFIYATALTLATITVILTALAARQPTTVESQPVTVGHTTTSSTRPAYGNDNNSGDGEVLDADRFTPLDGDTSRYHRPTNQLTTGLAQGMSR